MSDVYRMLEEYGNSNFYPFHMPGHKRNQELPVGDILLAAQEIDITEIEEFDNLHQPEGMLLEAQIEAAKLYGAEESFFLVNGSTSGILSAVFSVTRQKDRILMARNCHRSVYHSAYLRELKIDYVSPDLIEEYNIADAVNPDEIAEILLRQPQIAAVILTSPTYEGVVSDIRKIAEIVHGYGIPLIVDEAHGAHFGFHEYLPENAVRLGADIVIHSLHKTLPALTQTAILHVSGERVAREKLRRYLKIFQTSSPSYVLMSSIDSCMELMKEEGRERLEKLFEKRKQLINKTVNCRNIKVVSGLLEGEFRKREMDAGKILLVVENGRMTGQELYDILRENYHLQPEMAAENYVLLIFTLSDTEKGIERLGHAITEIDELIDREKKSLKKEIRKITKLPETVMTMSEALEKESEEVTISDGAGRIAGEFLNLYPPGVPLAVPGERLSNQLIDYVKDCLLTGLNIQGVKDGEIKVIAIEDKDNISEK